MASGTGVLADYLRARRARLRPEDVGFPPDPRRRVSGLRRTEVAELAGISAEYYTRLEQGRTYQLSESVLKGLANALQLDESATEYLYRIALPTPPKQQLSSSGQVSDLVARIVAEWSESPVYVADRNMDILLANDLALAMFPDVLAASGNVLESVFLASVEARASKSWRTVAANAVAALRFQSDPSDPRLHEIVGGLSVGDTEFRQMWADHSAEPLRSGVVRVDIHGVGNGEIPWLALDVPGGHTMIVYLASPGTFAAKAVAHLRRTMDETAAART